MDTFLSQLCIVCTKDNIWELSSASPNPCQKIRTVTLYAHEISIVSRHLKIEIFAVEIVIHFNLNFFSPIEFWCGFVEVVLQVARINLHCVLLSENGHSGTLEGIFRPIRRIVLASTVDWWRGWSFQITLKSGMWSIPTKSSCQPMNMAWGTVRFFCFMSASV